MTVNNKWMCRKNLYNKCAPKWERLAIAAVKSQDHCMLIIFYFIPVMSHISSLSTLPKPTKVRRYTMILGYNTIKRTLIYFEVILMH